FLARQILGLLRNPRSGCQIHRAEVVHLLRLLAVNDKVRHRIMRGRSNRKRQNDENKSRNMQTFHHSLLSEARSVSWILPRNALQHNLGMLWHASIVYTIGSPQNPMVRQTFRVPGATVQFTISTEG